MSSVLLHVEAPLVTVKKYSEMVGISVGSVRSKINKGHVPTVKQGRNRLINVALLTKQALEAEE